MTQMDADEERDRQTAQEGGAAMSGEAFNGFYKPRMKHR